MINKHQLEDVLIKNWANFLDIRKLRKLVESIIQKEFHFENINLRKISLSRFEMQENGFLVWIETTTNSHHITSEIFLFNTGSVKHVESILNDIQGQ